MELEMIQQFVKPELFILAAFLWCLGLFLKQAPWFTSEWVIPFILLFVSIISTILYIAVINGEGFTPAVIVMGVIQAVLIAALAVFGNELLKQILKKRIDDALKIEYVHRDQTYAIIEDKV